MEASRDVPAQRPSYDRALADALRWAAAAKASDYQESRPNLSKRTRAHELHLFDRHLAPLRERRQDVAASELARLLPGLAGRLSPWTVVAVLRILRGTFSLAVRRGTLIRSPVDGLAPQEIPKQRNARPIEVLDAEAAARLVHAGTSERWRAHLPASQACGLARFAR